MAEVKIGSPDRLSTDIGPVISMEAKRNLEGHIAAMRERGFPVHAPSLPEDCEDGVFVAPTLIEIDAVGDLTREVFGPVLHVLRYRRDGLAPLLDQINSSGYGLTGGAHSRIDATIALISEGLSVGNIYINRNIIGAVVGSQPFGGHALSGTGPKAGGPLYLKRLLGAAPADWPPLSESQRPSALRELVAWLADSGRDGLARRCGEVAAHSRLGAAIEMPGPVGERNLYRLGSCGTALCHAASDETAIVQLACAFATGNRAALGGPAGIKLFETLPARLREETALADEATSGDVVMTDAEGEALLALLAKVAAREGPIVSVHALSRAGFDRGEIWPCDFLLIEQSVTINTTAAGGNASLMSIG
jgi:RHH-type proline utilization regulon transcriptional repressor/proline dehydrogenase/delta 1-pyrroline-5-carboxylate dehydrogenase